MTPGESSPLPKGWRRDLLRRANLEASFYALEGYRHFHADTMRGRIRSLQVRPDEAWMYFDRAEALSENADSVPELRRTFLLHVYRLHNALLEDPLPDDVQGEEPPLPGLPLDYFEALGILPLLRPVLYTRREVQAIYFLHVGRLDEALEVFTDLANERYASNAELAYAYLSIACCHHGLGNEQEIPRFVDAAELATRACEETLYRTRLAGLLFAVHSVLGDRERAAEWKDFLYSLPCPQATRDLFLSRGESCVSLWRGRARLVVL